MSVKKTDLKFEGKGRWWGKKKENRISLHENIPSLIIKKLLITKT